FACCCSYASAQDAAPGAAPDAIAGADPVMMLVEDAASCAANPAACAVHVYAGRGAAGSGAGNTTGGGSPANGGSGAVGPAGVSGSTGSTSGGMNGTGSGGTAS
ncbi:hypothetical protein SB861_58540, partial [Paraburkholderia sp. SIMBA_049]